jgi:hypothetical protein
MTLSIFIVCGPTWAPPVTERPMILL